MGIAGFKAALCLSYLRLLSGTSKKLYRAVIWAVLIISTLGHFAATLILIFNCKPVGEFIPIGVSIVIYLRPRLT